jgi:hypothetical protein
MVARYIAQVSLLAEDGLPRDAFENVWHFTTGSTGGVVGDVPLIGAELGTFYNHIEQYLSPVIGTPVTVKVYDEDDVLTPRPLLGQYTFGFSGGNGFTAVPEEIALCMSYYAAQNLKGSRGRLYLGPLAVSAFDNSTTEGGNGVRPAAAFRSAIATAAKALINTASPVWCVRVSKPAVAYLPITAGWIDDEWDGQSRRRLAATTRTKYSATTP